MLEGLGNIRHNIVTTIWSRPRFRVRASNSWKEGTQCARLSQVAVPAKNLNTFFPSFQTSLYSQEIGRPGSETRVLTQTRI